MFMNSIGWTITLFHKKIAKLIIIYEKKHLNQSKKNERKVKSKLKVKVKEEWRGRTTKQLSFQQSWNHPRKLVPFLFRFALTFSLAGNTTFFLLNGLRPIYICGKLQLCFAQYCSGTCGGVGVVTWCGRLSVLSSGDGCWFYWFPSWVLYWSYLLLFPVDNKVLLQQPPTLLCASKFCSSTTQKLLQD